MTLRQDRTTSWAARVVGAAALFGGTVLLALAPGAAPAGATGGSVSDVSVTVAPEATGYKDAIYTVAFTATDGITETSTTGPEIQILAPSGTVFPYGDGVQSITDYTHPTDSTRSVCGDSFEPGVFTISCGVVASPGDSIAIRIGTGTSGYDVTNPTTSSSDDTLTVTTDNDPTPVTSAPYQIRPEGYWLVGSDGGIFTFGSAQFYGSTGNLHLNRPVVGITPTADRGGYWLDASDGGVFSFGDTQFYGSIPGLGIAPAGTDGGRHLNAPIVGMVPSVDDHGYFMVASDGGVFAFGDAQFEGSCPGIGGCAGNAVAVMPDATGRGYWLVTDIGAVYAFGDATYDGAPGNTGNPVVSAVRTPDGGGYWILDSAGTVHGYGDAANLGNANVSGYDSASAIFTDVAGDGYGIVTQDGSVTALGGVPNEGGLENTNLNGSIIAASGF